MSIQETQPEPITFKEHIFDFSFHPSNDIVAVGLINGQVQCFNYSLKQNELAWSTQVSKKSLRGVEFTNDGAHLMSISRDKSIQALDVSNGRLLYKIPKAHKYPINKICKLDTNLTATGDDEGIVKIWDMRTCKSIAEYKVHDDFISDMNYCKSSLLVASGDGLLSIHDTRQLNQKVMLSDEIDDELLSMTVVKNGESVIAGSQSGALYIWDWNKWEKTTKWIGHPSSVDAICKLDESAICTGASDGLLRFISLLPKKFEGILGDHGQDFPIECVKMKNNYLASCAHDLQLKFWNIQFLFEQDQTKRKYSDEIDDDDDNGDLPLMKRAKTRGQFFENM